MKSLYTILLMCASIVVNAQFNGSATVIANDDNVEITNGGTVTYSVLCNDTYISPDSVTVSIDTTASNGTVTDNGDGSFTYTNTIPYQDETITYTLTHVVGNSDNGTINITNTSVAPVNNAPIATNDNGMANMGLDVIVSVLINDNDADSDPLTVTNTTDGNNGTVVTNGTTITYIPTDTNWAGYDTVTYTISDGNGGLDTATVYIQSGSNAQIVTYDIISPYFNTPLTAGGTTYTNSFTINSNGIADQTGYGPFGPNSVSTVNWVILSSGELSFSKNGITMSPLSVAPFSTQINNTGPWYFGYSLGNTYNYILY